MPKSKEQLEELFKKLSNKETIEFNENYGRWRRGALECGHTQEEIFWEVLLVKELSHEQWESDKKTSEMVPKGPVKSLSYAISRNDSAAMTKIWGFPEETIDERIKNAIASQELMRKFLGKYLKNLETYSDNGLPLVYTRSRLLVDSNGHISLIRDVSKHHKIRLIINFGDKDFPYDAFEISAITPENLKYVSAPLDYHIERFKEFT